MEIRVRHLTGSKSGQEEVFDASVLRLGREPSNDIAFDPYEDIVVSGRHAELSFDGRDWVIKDLGSSNGTFIDGERISIRSIRSGENIQLGRGGPRLEIRFAAAEAIPSTTMEDLPPRDFPQTVILGSEDLAAAREVTLIGPDAPDMETLRQGTFSRQSPPVVTRPTLPPSVARRKSPLPLALGAAAVLIVLIAGIVLMMRPKPEPPKVVPTQTQAFASRAELDKLRSDLAARESQLNDLQQKVRTSPQISVYASRDLDKQVKSAQETIEQLRAQLQQKNSELSKVPATTAAAAQPEMTTATAAEETFDVVPRPKAFRKRLHVSAEESGGNVAGELARSLASVLASTGRFVIDPDSGPHVSVGVLNYQSRGGGVQQPNRKFRLFGRRQDDTPIPSDVAVTASVGIYDGAGRQLGFAKPTYALNDARPSPAGGSVGQLLTADTPLADTVRYVVAAAADEVLNATESLEPEMAIRSVAGDDATLDAGRNVGIAADDVFDILDGGRVIARAHVESVQENSATATIKPSNANVAGKQLRYAGIKRGERPTQPAAITERSTRVRYSTDAREGPGTSFKTASPVGVGTELRIVYTVGSWSRVRVGDRTVWVPTAALDV